MGHDGADIRPGQQRSFGVSRGDAEMSIDDAVALRAETNGLLTVSPEQAPPQQQEAQTPFVRDGRKVGRNEPCPCGSGKKFKQCHGKLS